MTPALTYALGAMLCFGIGDLVYKQGAAAGAPAHHFLMVQTWFFGPLVLAYALLTHGLVWNPGALWGGIAGLFMLTGFYNFARSLKTGSISINAPVFRLSFVLTAVLAVVFLGEPLTAFKVAGIALALAAAWLLLGAPSKDAHARRESRAALLRVLFATTMVGLGNFIYKFGLMAGATPASMIVAQAVMVVPAATLFVVLVDGRIRPAAAALRHAPRAALALAAAFSLLLEALARGDASAVVPVAQMGFVVTALIGTLFLNEGFTLRKSAGLVAALAALASLAGFAPLAHAAEDPACLAAYKDEARRIGLQAERDAQAHPPGKDLEAQQRFMAPVHAALKAAAEKADRCQAKSRGAAQGPSAEASRRAAACTTAAEARVAGLHRRYGGRGDLSRAEQDALRKEENRIMEVRTSCLREAR